MIKTVIFGVFVACALQEIKSYDFQDPYFNDKLASDWRSIYDSLQEEHIRSRRDEDGNHTSSEEDKCRCKHHHHHRGPKLCCGEELLNSIHESTKDVTMKCFKEVVGTENKHKGFDMFSCEAVEKLKSDMTCIEQCKWQQLGLLDDDGTTNEDLLKTIVKDAFTADQWPEKTTDKIVEKCVEKAKNYSKYPAKFYTKGLKSCHPFAMSFAHCLFKEMQYNCPVDQIKDQEACQKFRHLLEEPHHGPMMMNY